MPAAEPCALAGVRVGGTMMEDATAAQRNALLGELTHRREKQWKIFSWAAGLFVAMIEGL
jgi:hypothetical protein